MALQHRQKKWYVLLEESKFDTLSVTGPFHLHAARTLADTLIGDAYVVNGWSGHLLTRDLHDPKKGKPDAR